MWTRPSRLIGGPVYSHFKQLPFKSSLSLTNTCLQNSTAHHNISGWVRQYDDKQKIWNRRRRAATVRKTNIKDYFSFNMRALT